MDPNKIVINYVCPKCNTPQNLSKPRDVKEGLLYCPKCKTGLKFFFDVTKEPQEVTVKVLTPADIPANQAAKSKPHRETVYVGKVGMPDGQVPGAAPQMPPAQNAPSAGQNAPFSPKYVRPGDEVPSAPFNAATPNPSRPYPGMMPPASSGGAGFMQQQQQQQQQQERLLPLNEPVFIIRLGGLFGKSHKDKFQVFEGRTVIGRTDPMQHSDIEFSHDPEMSRQSLELFITPNYVRGNEYRLTVLRSTNLVYVNEFPVRVGEKVFLQFGDIITLGNTKLLFDNK